MISKKVKNILDDAVAAARERELDVDDCDVIAKFLNKYSTQYNLTQTEENELMAGFIGLTFTQMSVLEDEEKD